jgi:Na+/H+-translocating membrane pyrophosphatase
MGMFSTAVFILAMSGFGPIVDNAGGIIEMGHEPDNVRVITDLLDSAGNVTKVSTFLLHLG